MKTNNVQQQVPNKSIWDLPRQGPYSNEEKLQWEVAKLQQDVSNLQKPWIRQPGSWISIVTTLLALVVGGYNLNLASYQKERNLWAADKAQKEAIEASELRDKTLAEKKRAQVDVQDAQNQLKNIKQQAHSLKRAAWSSRTFLIVSW